MEPVRDQAKLALLAVPRGLEPLTFGLGSIEESRRVNARSDKIASDRPLSDHDELALSEYDVRRGRTASGVR
jgi:hypothetical protein